MRLTRSPTVRRFPFIRPVAWTIVAGGIATLGVADARGQTAADAERKKPPVSDAPPASSVTAPPAASAAPAPPLVKPSDDELRIEFLANPSEKARQAFDAYKAGRFDEARKLAESLATAGDANGMFLAGLCHQFGRGGQPSLTDAERRLREGAAKGHSAARTSLALLLYSTSGNDKDRLAEAVRLLRESSTQDPARAAMPLGELYARGIGVTADFGEAERQFDAAIKAGQPRGWIAKGLLYGGGFGFEKEQNQEKADESLRKAADAGVVEAMVMLGQRKLRASKGEGPLLTEGLKWVERAAEKGAGDAYVVLGTLAEEGRLVKKDPARAVEYFRKGAEAGHAGSLARLGACYENGVGVPKDAQRAFENYKAAADRGLPEALYNVAVCYDAAIGVEKSPATAFRYYAASAKAGLAVGMNETGLRYQTGAGTLEDVVAAAAWYTLAAQAGNIASQVNLARMYLQGLGVPRNVGTSVQLYSAAAQAGHPVAAFELAQLLEYGAGTAPDLVKAHALYAMAADYKNANADEKRKALAKSMSKDQLTAAELVRKGLPPGPSVAATDGSTPVKPPAGGKSSKPAPRESGKR